MELSIIQIVLFPKPFLKNLQYRDFSKTSSPAVHTLLPEILPSLSLPDTMFPFSVIAAVFLPTEISFFFPYTNAVTL